VSEGSIKGGDVERNEKERWVEMKHKIAGDEEESERMRRVRQGEMKLDCEMR
jgi:hypothetical protein